MNLLYDNLVYDLQSIGGISSYWYELTIRFLQKEEVTLQFYEGKRPAPNLWRAKLPITRDQMIRLPGYSSLVGRLFSLPPRNHRHIFHSSYYRVPIKNPLTTVVTTVHDFTYEKYYAGARTLAHRYLKHTAIKGSDQLIAISQNTKQELLDFHPQIAEDKVKVIYHGASKAYHCLAEPAKPQERPFLLFVGAREAYKNFDFAVRLTVLCQEFDLYIVGNQLSKAETKTLNQVLGHRYRCFQQISDAELNVLYNGAFCLLYPSANEGFGIPLLEAMQAGCPFIALNASAIPEVAGNAGMLMEHLDLEEALQAIERIKTHRSGLVQLGFAQSAKFSWDKCFQETYALYHSLMT